MLRLVALLAAIVLPASGFSHAPGEKTTEKPATTGNGTTVLAGSLAHQNDAPILKVKERSYILTSADNSILTTLADVRNRGRQLELHGRWKNPETFVVERFLVRREGKLFKLVYYCDVCNITTYQPGPCDCCREPTEPREIPYDPRGVH